MRMQVDLPWVPAVGAAAMDAGPQAFLCGGLHRLERFGFVSRNGDAVVAPIAAQKAAKPLAQIQAAFPKLLAVCSKKQNSSRLILHWHAHALACHRHEGLRSETNLHQPVSGKPCKGSIIEKVAVRIRTHRARWRFGFFEGRAALCHGTGRSVVCTRLACLYRTASDTSRRSVIARTFRVAFDLYQLAVFVGAGQNAATDAAARFLPRAAADNRRIPFWYSYGFSCGAAKHSFPAMPSAFPPGLSSPVQNTCMGNLTGRPHLHR